jgi:hypothetical protein
LYDQLQLLQVLHHRNDSSTGKPFFLVQHPKFFGLNPAEVRTLHAQRRPVSKEQMTFATEAWRAFDTPENLLRIVHKKIAPPIAPLPSPRSNDCCQNIPHLITGFRPASSRFSKSSLSLSAHQ